MKPKPNRFPLRRLNLASGTTAIHLCLAAAASAAWNGSTSSDWNTATNWGAGTVPAGRNAVINITEPNPATISADLAGTPVDIIVGTGAGSNGLLVHSAGNASTGAGNWAFVGTDGGTGTYHLADTSATGGTFTGFGTGSGSLNVAGRLYVGGNGAAGSTGLMNVNTTGSIVCGTQLQVGQGGSTGVLNFDAGSITTNDWTEIGNGANANGTLNMSGGTFTKAGGQHFIVAANGATGLMNMSGGTLTVNNEIWVGNAGGSNGTLNFSGGSITNGSWVAIGRDNGTGTVNMTGGTWVKNGGGNFIVGASGPGTMIQSGGLVDVQTGITWIGEANNAPAIYTLSGTGEFRTSHLLAGRDGGTTGNVNLEGGTLVVGRLQGGNGATTLNLDGALIVSSRDENQFLFGFDTATILGGGVTFDTAGHNVVATQNLSGSGGVVKTGEGSLHLGGLMDYTGPTTINGGSLSVTTSSTGEGAYSVAAGAGLGVAIDFFGSQLVAQDVNLGADTRLEMDLGSFGNPSEALLDVTGTLTLQGETRVNITTSLPELGQFELIRYGTLAGGGSLALGDLPPGVQAQLVPNPSNNSFDLNITRAILLEWVGGEADGLWDVETTQNWTNVVNFSTTAYEDGDPVIFNDISALNFDIVLNSTVMPGDVLFDNFIGFEGEGDFTLSGSGKISGTTGLTKRGDAGLVITTENDFTGPARLEGGTVTVSTLPNAGQPGPLGAGELHLAGGALVYTGPDTTSDRGWHLAGTGSRLVIENDVAISGPLSAALESGNFIKAGPGTLTLSHPGTHVISSGGAPGIRVDAGKLVFEGGGTQVNTSGGELWSGTSPDTPVDIELRQTTLNVGGWIALGRGHGSGGRLSTFTAIDSTITSGNFSTGFDNGIIDQDSIQEVTLTNSTWTNTGNTNLAESNGSKTTFVVAGDSTFTSSARVLIGQGATAVGEVIVRDSGTFTHTGGWLSVGQNGTGTVTVQDNGTFNSNQGSDFNVTDLLGSRGTFNIRDNATVNAGSVFIGKAAETDGVLNMEGGTFNGGNTNVFQIGQNGVGVWNQTAGITNASGWVALGRFATGNGTLNISGGEFHQTTGDRALIVGEEGTGKMVISGDALVTAAAPNGVWIGLAATGNGAVELNGGSLVTRRVQPGAGPGSFAFNGGRLVVGANPNPDFMFGLTSATIGAGGAIIDTAGHDVTIAQDLTNDDGGGITKLGAGALTLSGSSNHAGATTVSEGTLRISGDQSAAAGAVTVAAGATLGGFGSTGGSVTVNGTLAPGDPTGTLSVGGSLTMAAGTAFTTLVDEASSGGVGAVSVSGNLDVSGASLTVNLNGSPARPAYVIASYGSLTGTFSSASLPPGATLDYAYDNGSGSNHIAVIFGDIELGYDSWAATNGATGGPTGDPDRDGVSNGIEFVIGGDPAGGNSNALLPVVEDPQDPDSFNVVFRRTIDSLPYSPYIEYGDPVGGWTRAVNGENGIVIEVEPDGFGAGIDRVTVRLPRALAEDDKLFARLRIDI